MSPGPQDPVARIGPASIAMLLVPSLGEERSTRLVFEESMKLGYGAGALDSEDALRLVDSIARHGGLIGIAARLARARLLQVHRVGAPAREPNPRQARQTPRSLSRSREAKPQSWVASSRGDADSWSKLPPQQVALVELVELMAPALGREKSEVVVADAARRLAFPDPLDMSDALELFETLARQTDLVGIVARFAKARLALRPS